MADDFAVLLEKFKHTQLKGAGKLLGMAFEELDADGGRSVLSFDVPAEFCNPLGTIQGGIQTAMMDEAMTCAAIAQSQVTKVVPTLEIKSSFLAPAAPGRVLAEGRVVRMGRSVVFMEGHLTNPEGKLLATASATGKLAPIPRRKKD